MCRVFTIFCRDFLLSLMIITQTRLQQLKPYSSSTVTRMTVTELTKLKTATALCIHTTSRYVTYLPAVSLGRTIFTTCKQIQGVSEQFLNGTSAHKRPFSALKWKQLPTKKTEQIKITRKIKATEWVSVQLLKDTSAQCRLRSALLLKLQRN